ncbi:MAG: WYL domain-containing protein [Oscillospiraceae bacterium]|nr:WYL domain-containing protein [Oscillospiraceae bacterium]
MGIDRTASKQKGCRMLHIYARLINGEIINKKDEADRFGKSSRTIQNDIEDIREFLADRVAVGEIENELVYDAKLNGYYLKTVDERTLSNSEIFAVCKILLESRAFCKSDIEPIIEKLIFNCIPKSKHRAVRELISNEIYHYVEPRHGKHFIKSMWEIAEAVRQHLCIKMVYERLDGTIVNWDIQPVGIMFSEFYFYLMAFIENIDKEAEFKNPDDIFPTIYRIDRIQSFEVLNRHFDIPYRDRFEEGEFRKRIQFMYGGKLRRIRFLYKGVNPEAVLDRLPTAKIVEKNDDGYVITAEVFGDGVDMWIRSQGEWIEMF